MKISKVDIAVLCSYGSGFNLDADRDYHQKGDPLIFHLRCFGMVFDDNYEGVGKDLNKLVREAVKNAKKNIKILKASIGEYDEQQRNSRRPIKKS